MLDNVTSVTRLTSVSSDQDLAPEQQCLTINKIFGKLSHSCASIINTFLEQKYVLSLSEQEM